MQEADGTIQMAKVADGLDVSSLLTTIPLASSGAPDVVGAFRFLCAPSHISYDDPIVHPGKPGGDDCPGSDLLRECHKGSASFLRG